MLRRNQLIICIAYLLFVTCAEIVTIYEPKIGIISHAVILLALISYSALESDTDRNFSLFLLALVLAPLIRILSLSMPFIRLNFIHGFLLISIPLYIAIIICMRVQELRPKEVGLCMPKPNRENMRIGMAVILFAIPVGIVEYLILKPAPLQVLGVPNFIVYSLIFFLCTGLLEELAFRGLIQYNAIKMMNKWWGILFVSTLFGVLHLGNICPWHLDCVLAFSVGFVFSIVREKTGSIYAISVSHGLINIVLFLIAPLYL